MFTITSYYKKIFIPMVLSINIFSISFNAVAEIENVKNKDDIVIQEKNYRLRCWQEGKLLFEEVGLRSKFVKSDIKLIGFEKALIKNSGVSLFVVGSSTCLFKKM